MFCLEKPSEVQVSSPAHPPPLSSLLLLYLGHTRGRSLNGVPFSKAFEGIFSSFTFVCFILLLSGPQHTLRQDLLCSNSEIYAGSSFEQSLESMLDIFLRSPNLHPCSTHSKGSSLNFSDIWEPKCCP